VSPHPAPDRTFTVARTVIVDAHLHVDEIPALGWQLEGRNASDGWTRPGSNAAVVMTIVDAPEVNPDALDLIADGCAGTRGAATRSRASTPVVRRKVGRAVRASVRARLQRPEAASGVDDRPSGR